MHCPKCGQKVRLRRDGTFYYHRDPSGMECPASGQARETNPEFSKRDPLSQAIDHVAKARDAVVVYMAQGGAAVNLADDFLRIAETQLEEARERRRRGTI